MAKTRLSNQKCWQYIRALNSADDERLDSIAIKDGTREYTYRRMFRRWQLCAEAFSGLGISGDNRSRAGLTGIPAAETVIAYYALNMTGTSVSMIHSSDLMDEQRFGRMIKEEGITDLVLADSLLDPEFLERILKERKALGIRRIVVLQIPKDEEGLSDEERLRSRLLQRQIRRFRGVHFMDEICREYAGYDIESGHKNDDAAVIAHTSGTVSGIHKPVPLSDKGLNEAAESLLADERFSTLRGRAVSALFLDMSSAYAMTDMVHLTFAFGGTLVAVPGVRYMEDIAEVLVKYGVNVLFATGAYMNALMKLGDKPDLSALEFVFVGGSRMSAYSKGKYDGFLVSCGAKARVTAGYGLSETAGACILSEPDREDDSMGRPLAGVRVKLYDEDNDKFYDLSDGPRRGVLFISSPSVSSGRIDGRSFFDLRDTCDGMYLNTYDLVDAGADGYLRYAGRMNRYFVNNEGIRFDAGLIEAALSAQPGIESCCITPGYDKTMHDTIPVLNVTVSAGDESPAGVIEEALRAVFIEGGLIRDTNLPGQCRIADRLPMSDTGKPDARRIAGGGVKGRLYCVRPERPDGVLKDIELVPFRDAPGLRSGLPDELERKEE